MEAVQGERALLCALHRQQGLDLSTSLEQAFDSVSQHTK